MLRALKAGAIVVLSLGLAGLAYPDHKDKYHGAPLDARQHGYEHGYRDGFHEGVKDRGDRNKYKPEVKDDDKGYESYMGKKGAFKDGYRAGFGGGYDDGFYNRTPRFSEIYGPYNDAYRARGSADRYDDVYVERRWRGSDVAYDIGYRDGLTSGQDDYTRRRVARAEDQRDFQDADHGYRPDYGDRAMYREQYRSGFLRGYSDGYRGVR